MIAHILAVAAAVILVGGIFGLILWAHIADQRAFERDSLAVTHKTCKHVDLLEEARREAARKDAPDAAVSLGKFLGELLMTAAFKRQAA